MGRGGVFGFLGWGARDERFVGGRFLEVLGSVLMVFVFGSVVCRVLWWFGGFEDGGHEGERHLEELMEGVAGVCVLLISGEVWLL